MDGSVIASLQIMNRYDKHLIAGSAQKNNDKVQG